MSGFVQAARGLVSRVARVLSAAGSIQPAAWALALLALMAANVSAAGPAHAQAFSYDPSTAGVIYQYTGLSADHFAPSSPEIQRLGGFQAVGYAEFYIPAGVYFSAASLRYTAFEYLNGGGVEARVTAADGIDLDLDSAASQIDAGATYASFQLPGTSSGVVPFNAVAIQRMNQIAQSGGGTLRIGFAGGAGEYGFLFDTFSIEGVVGVAAAVTSVSPNSGATEGGDIVTLNGSGFTGVTAVNFGNTQAPAFSVVNDALIFANSPAGVAGTVSVSVTAPAGVSPPAAGATFTYLAQPDVTALSSDAGPTTGGNAVVITGTDMTGATAVNFGARPAAFVVDSATQITATAPAGTGQVQVRVTTPGGTSAEVGAGYYSYVSAPTLTAVSPLTGPVAGGTRVELTGSGFFGSTVLFDGVAGTDPAVFADSQMYITTPAGTAGAVDVQVQNPGGTATMAGAFTYVAAPTGTVTITGAPDVLAIGNAVNITVTPSVAPPSGGLTVQLTAGGSAGGVLSASTLVFTTASPQTFTFNTASPAGLKTIQYSLSGADAGVYAAPAATSINVVTAGLTVSGAPANMTVGEVATITVTPSMAPANGDLTVTLSKAGGGTLSTSVLTFTSAAPQTFTYTATAPAGPVQISMVRGGADRLAFSQPANINISVSVAAPTVTTPANNSVLTSPTVNLSGTVSPGATYVVRLGGDGSLPLTPVVATSGAWTRTLTGLRNGNYTVRIDDQTNALSSANTNFTIAVPMAFDTISASGNVLTVTGTLGMGVPADLQFYDSAFSPIGNALVTGGQDGTWTAVFDMGNRPTGTYNLRLFDWEVTYVNEPFAYTDTTLPATPILLSPSTANPITADSVVLSGTAEPNAEVAVYIDDLQVGVRRADSSGAWTFTISGSGEVRVNLEAFDASGNRSGLSQPYVFNFVKTPTISSISPALGSAPAPESVTISGSNFSASGNSVTFGGVAGTITAESATSITVTPPTSATQGLVDVVVTNAGNQSVAQDDGYRYLLPPTLVVEFSPPTLGAGATGSFRLTFTNPNDVAVSGLALSDTQFPTGLTSIGSTNGCSNGSVIVAPNRFRIAGGSIAANASCTVSRGATSTTVGSYSVTTGVPSITGPVSVVGTATSTATPLTVISAPTLATISPNAGPQVGGTSITITGTGLDGATAVSIFDAQATNIVVASDGLSLTATTGATFFPGTYSVFVRTPGGDVQGLAFTYAAEPIIFTIDPVSGSTAGGTVVTLSGVNFSGATAVTFGGVAATSFTVNSDTSITATTPVGTAGAVPVAVTTIGGTGTRANGYTFVAPPAAPVVSVPADASATNDNAPTYSGTAAGSATVEVFVDGSSIGTTTSAGGGAWTLTQPTALADGSHTVYATATTLGGTSVPSATITFTVNTVPPVITGLSINQASIFQSPLITVTGSNFSGATALTFDGVPANSFIVVDDTTITATVRLRGSSGTVQVRVVGPATTSADAGAVDDFRYIGLPVVTGVSPAAGSTEGGNVLTITGTDFVGVTRVDFTYPAPGGGVHGFTAQNLIVDSDTQVRVTMPDLRGHLPNGGTIDVLVTNLARQGEAQAGSADNYLLVAPPTVVGIAPSGGPLTAGTRVTLSGERLDTVTGVTVGGVPATNLSATTTELSFDAPAGTGGQPVALVWAYGTVSGPTYAYYPPPAAPTLLDAPLALSNSRDATFRAAGFGLEIRLDGGAFVSMTPQPFTFTGLADGPHTVDVRRVDDGGPGALTTHVWTIDATAPGAPVVTSPVNSLTTADATPSITGTAEAGASVTVTIDGSAAGTVTADGAGTWTFTTGTLAEGSHTVFATATDVAGNVSSGSATVSFTVDSTVPTAPVLTSPADGERVNSFTPTMIGTVESGAEVLIYIDGGFLTSVPGFATNGGDWGIGLPALGEGAHTIYTIARDTAGNMSPPSATTGFVIDTIAPAAPVLTLPANGSITSVATPTVSGTAEIGASVVVTIDGSVAGTVMADGSGNWVFTPSALADGSHTVRARATDAAGNVSSDSATVSFTVDATAPAAPVVTFPVNGTTLTNRTPLITGTAEPGTTVVVTVGGGTRTVTADGSGNWSSTPNVLTDGTHIVLATSTDSAGNASPASAPVTFVIDLTAPAAPVIAAPTANQIFGLNTPTFSGTAEAGASVVISLNGSPAETVAADGSGNWTQTSAPLADGMYAMTATAVDAVGNISSVSLTTNFTVDTVAPAPSLVRNPVNFSVIPDSTPTFEGRTEGGATVTITLDGTVVGTATANGFGDWSLTSAPLADGPHTFSAVATDRAGNSSAATPTITFTVDATAPLAPTIITPVNESLTSSRDVTFSGTSEIGTFVEVMLDDVVFANGTTDGSGGWRYGLTGLADGTYELTAYAQDAAGNRSPVSRTKVTVDATAPAAPVITAPVDGTVTREARPTITGTADRDSTVQLTLNGGPPIIIPITSKDGSWSYAPTTDLAAGLNLLSAVAVDDAGNVSAVSATVRVTYSPITITTTTLASGQVGVAYAATIEVNGGTPPYSLTVSAGALPGGVTLSDGGALSGTPTASGDFAFTVTATDANGLSTSQALSLGVARPADPEVTDVDEVEVTANPNGSGEPTVIDLSGSVRNATRIEIVTPPANGTATVDGFAVTYSPSPGYFGTDSFTYRAVGFVDGGAANAAPAPGGSPSSAVSEPATVSIIIAAPTLTLAGGVQPAGEVGVAYSQVLTTSGGTAPYTYAVTAGALPTGITLDGDGTLSGSPTAGGTFSFTVTATDSSTGTGPFSVSAVHDLTIAAPTLMVTPSTLPNAVAAQEYSATFTTSGGTGPYSYTVTAGTLPAGMSLSTAGVLSGVPTQGGVFAFTVTATDASTGAGPYSASQAMSLTVTASAIAVTPATLAGGTRGTPYVASVSASGGVAPYTYAVSAGALPTGLSLSPAGEISGTPTALGTFAFQISATDSATGAGPYSGTVDLSVTVTALTLVVTPTVLPDVLAGVPYSQQLAASGGQGGYTFALTAGSLPPGLTLTTAGLIDGKPTTAGVFAFTVTATDGFGNTGAAALTVTVTGRPDPGADPDVRGLNAAQGEATRRMVGTQIDNFGRRLEQLHTGAEGQDAYALNLTLDGSAFSPLDEARQARGQLGEAMSAVDPGRHDSTDRAELDRMVWGDRDTASGPGARADGRMNAAGQEGGASSGTGLRVWAGGAISLGERDATTQTAEMSITTSGLSVGVDASVTDQLDLGVGVGMGQENVDVGLEDSRLESDSWVGVVYASWRPQGDLFLDGMLGYGQLGFDMRRRTPVDNSLVFGQRDGTALFGSLSAGLDRDIGAARWIGYGRIDVLDADLDAYAETGSPLWALSYDARNLQSRQGSLGLRYERVVLRGTDRWTPGLRAEWTHEFGDAEAQTLRYADWLDGPSYSIAQDGWQRSRLTLGLSLGWRSDSGWSWLAEYEGRYSDGETLNGLRIKLAKLF